MSEQLGRNLKVVLLGETGVGKTSLITRYTKNTFDPDSPSTIAGSFSSKTLKCKLTILWSPLYGEYIDKPFENSLFVQLYFTVLLIVFNNLLAFLGDKLFNPSTKEYKSTVENSISYSSNYRLSTYYKIGYDLSAGTYTLDGDDFYYSICTKPSCKISIDENEIIDNNNVKGSSTITVKDGQYLIIAGNGKVTATK